MDQTEILHSRPFLVFNSSPEFTRCISSEYVLFCILLNCRSVKVYVIHYWDLKYCHFKDETSDSTPNSGNSAHVSRRD